MGGFFIFLAKTIAKKTIQMDFFKNIFAKKMGLFRFLAEKIFSVAASVVARRWSARTAARRSGRVWMDVPGRARMDAMEAVHV